MQKTPQEIRVTIAPQAIITVILTLVALWLLYIIRDIVLLFVLVLSVVVTLSPIVRSWEKYMPRALAILTLYILIFFIVALITALVFPVFIGQFIDFLVALDHRLLPNSETDSIIQRVRDALSYFGQGQGVEGFSRLFEQFKGSLGAVYSTTLGFIGGIVALLTVFITSFYLLQEEKNLQQFLAGFLPEADQKRISRLINRISTKMGSWLRGQLLLMLLVGLCTGIIMWIIGVPYPLVLGLFNGMMEAVPYVGPFIGALPGIAIAFALLGPIKGLITVVAYLLIQQLENQFFAPKIMGKALGLSPVIIIFALLTGGKLLGLIGVIIAIPVVAVLSVIYEEWRKEPS